MVNLFNLDKKNILIRNDVNKQTIEDVRKYDISKAPSKSPNRPNLYSSRNFDKVINPVNTNFSSEKQKFYKIKLSNEDIRKTINGDIKVSNRIINYQTNYNNFNANKKLNRK